MSLGGCVSSGTEGDDSSPTLAAMPSTLSTGAHRPVGDEGSLTLFMVVTVVALMVAVGLVVDGGNKIQALQRADAAAEEAARAAGQVIVPARSVRGQTPRADAGRAAGAARAYLAAAGITGSVDVRGDVIEVTTSITEPTVFLAAIGVSSVSATGNAQARLVRGLQTEVP